MPDNNKHSELLSYTAEIVASHLSHNTVAAPDIPALIERIYKTLSTLGSESKAATSIGERPQPAVPIRKSVMPDYIVCLEDGKKLKMLKRHIKTAYNMSPEQYRDRWGLPHDYPMVAPNYTKQRSKLAKDIGLGTSGRKTQTGKKG
ncbi:MAG TPA: MucR family transcriptional regulator [Alphaproteobacteria bacterium]|nr:MucR family transcriptional regulator [Alphaproteobacteria bacterium]MCB9984425.1 MucR family transcriptional regulator [Micavibrio sp.]HRK97810.1 MucR family transcriptional regulator [Alphaproteobacteria bacterium]